MRENTLYFGDNLKILRDNVRDETVDLIYLDPPSNSKADKVGLTGNTIRRRLNQTLYSQR